MEIIRIFSKDYIDNPEKLKKIQIANDIINSELQNTFIGYESDKSFKESADK